MTTSDRRMARIEAALETTFGRGAFPLEMVGDLDDLAETLRKTLSQVEAFYEGDSTDPESLRRQLYVLEIALEDDLPMIFKDLLSSLRKTRESTYESDDDENDAQ